jgi:hypothetical protein
MSVACYCVLMYSLYLFLSVTIIVLMLSLYLSGSTRHQRRPEDGDRVDPSELHRLEGRHQRPPHWVLRRPPEPQPELQESGKNRAPLKFWENACTKLKW